MKPMSSFAADRPVSLLVTIVDRKKGERVAALLRAAGLPAHTLCQGRGTASSEILDCLGLDEPKKDVLLSFFPADRLDALLGRLCQSLHLDKKGGGIAFSLPLETVFKHIIHPATGELLGLENNRRRTPMQQSEHKLVLAIVTRGGSDAVMDAARAAGAAGGTVLNARGLAPTETASFLGITIQPEKEILAILAPAGLAEPIIRAIDACLAQSRDLSGSVMCLPVEGCVGI